MEEPEDAGRESPGSRVVGVEELTGRQGYRLLTSLIVPRPIGWLGTRSRDGRPNLAPFSYFNGLSASAMLVGASIGQRRASEPGGSRVWKDTLLNIRETESFSVNIVTERHLEAMVRTSGEWPRGTSEFEEAGLEAGECERVDAPFVAGAVAVLECELFRVVELDAPNALVIGRVQAVRLSEALSVEDETMHVSVESLRPVGRLGLDQYTLLGEIRRIPRPRVDREEAADR